MSNILDNINTLEDFKKINKKDLPELASEIRKFLIDNIAETGGHLAPNLGVVELTMALHYVFNSPDDKIIFDVGHQCYVHKILTGRKNKFSTLRKTGGISGFPKARESIHDIFDTGHSSTSISSALGIAVANKLKGNDNYAIAVIGDGALTGGLAFEGLNNAKIDDTNLIVILNDNQMSISPSVGNLSAYLNKIRSNSLYTSTKESVKKFLSHVPLIGKFLIKLIESIKNAIREFILPNSVMFEQFGFTYLGPIDGHDINELISILERAKKVKKPVLVHVVTKKGKGYKYAEENPNKFHAISKFNKETGEVISKKAGSYSKDFGNTLVELAKDNSKIVAITAAMPDGTGLNEFAKSYPNRFFDVGIAECHAVTFASGLAKQGLIPVFAVYSTFLQRAYDQIVIDVALQKLHVIFAIDRAGIVGSDGETHHGIFDLSYLSHIPNLIVMAPKDGIELSKMLDFAVKYNGPIAIRYPRDGYVSKLTNTELPIELGKAEILTKGSDITIIAFGKTVLTATKIADIRKDKSFEIINLRFFKPIDKETILTSIRKTKNVVVIEDNVINGGISSCIKDLISSENGITARYFAYPDEFIRHGETSEIEDEFHMSAKEIAKCI